MSNLETRPAELVTGPGGRPAAGPAEVLEPRLIPLGGPRAMALRRTLPAVPAPPLPGVTLRPRG